MKTWFITGASSGLGRCFAEAALKRGDQVAAASIDPENMQDYPKNYGENVLVLDLDISKSDQVKEAFAKAVDTFGHIDVLVNNAGFMQCGAIESMEEDEVRRIFDCNFFGTFFLSKEAARHMRLRQSGTIIQIASLSAVDTIAGEGMYGATKHAVLGMSQALHMELEPFGVKVVIVEPGPVHTNMSKRAKLCRNPIHAYDKIVGSELDRWAQDAEYDLPGADPAKCAQVILKLADAQNPPREIVLSSFAYNVLQECTSRRLSWAEEWKADTVAADE